MQSNIKLFLTLILLMPYVLMSCGSPKKSAQQQKNVLVAVGDSVLTLEDVMQRMPSGLPREDSIALFEKIVDDWVRDLTLADYAQKNISDVDKIDRMVDSYRNNLIINEYLNSMTESNRSELSEERIKNYYDASHQSMILEQPLVRGLFLKVATNDESLPNLRQWLNNLTDDNLDKIEKSGLRRALQYKYFKDEWVEWNVISEQIPYRFFDSEAFLNSTKLFETEDNGSIYLLRITDYIPAGKEMPYEYAKLKIADILRQTSDAAYRKNLINEIYRRQIKEGVLKPGSYNPVK